MRTIRLTTFMILAPLTLLGCGGNTDKGQHDASVQHDPFEPDGAWLYLGPSDGPHRLKISDQSMEYTDVDGKWTSTWTVKGYDNGLHQFQVVFKTGSGTYLPVGQSMSGTYAQTEAVLTVQLKEGLDSYPSMQSPGSCTNGSDAIPECRLYVKQN